MKSAAISSSRLISVSLLCVCVDCTLPRFGVRRGLSEEELHELTDPLLTECRRSRGPSLGSASGLPLPVRSCGVLSCPVLCCRPNSQRVHGILRGSPDVSGNRGRFLEISGNFRRPGRDSSGPIRTRRSTGRLMPTHAKTVANAAFLCVPLHRNEKQIRGKSPSDGRFQRGKDRPYSERPYGFESLPEHHFHCRGVGRVTGAYNSGPQPVAIRLPDQPSPLCNSVER